MGTNIVYILLGVLYIRVRNCMHKDRLSVIVTFTLSNNIHYQVEEVYNLNLPACSSGLAIVNTHMQAQHMHTYDIETYHISKTMVWALCLW